MVPVELQLRAYSLLTAELVLKYAASTASFCRRSAALATFRHGLLIRGSLVRSQLGEPLFWLGRTSGGWRLTQLARGASRALLRFWPELRALAP